MHFIKGGKVKFVPLYFILGKFSVCGGAPTKMQRTLVL